MLLQFACHRQGTSELGLRKQSVLHQNRTTLVEEKNQLQHILEIKRSNNLHEKTLIWISTWPFHLQSHSYFMTGQQSLICLSLFSFMGQTLYFRNYLKSKMEAHSYQQFLQNTYSKILTACLQDQAVDTLKILQNKEYLLQRINELFIQIYQDERQLKLQELTTLSTQLHHLQQTQQSKPNSSCLSCEALQKQLFAIEKEKQQLIATATELSQQQTQKSSKVSSDLLKETQMLREQLAKSEKELNQKQMYWNQQKQNFSSQLLRLKIQLRNQQQAQQQRIEELKNNLNSALVSKTQIQKQLVQLLEQKGKQQKQSRSHKDYLNQSALEKEKLKTQVKILQEKETVCLERIERLEQHNKHLQDQMETMQKENRRLELQADALMEELNLPSHMKESKQRDSNPQDYYQLQQLNIELEKQNSALKLQLAVKTNQLNETTLSHQKAMLTLTETLKTTQIKSQKQLRELKQYNNRIYETTLEQCQDQKQKQLAVLAKKYETSLKEKEQLLDRTIEKNKTLSLTVTQQQSALHELNRQQQDSISSLSKQLQREKEINKEMKKCYEQAQRTTQLAQQEHKEQVEALQQDIETAHQSLSLKEKEIKQLNQQISSLQEQLQNQNFITNSLQLKHAQTVDSLINAQNNLKSISDTFRSKEKTIKESILTISSLKEQNEQLQSQIQSLAHSLQRSEQKSKRLQQELSQKSTMLLTVQEQNKNEVIEMYAQNHLANCESKKQLEAYYISLLKQHQLQASQEQQILIDKQKEQLIGELQMKNNELEDKLVKLRSRQMEKTEQQSSLQQKIEHLLDQIERVKKQNNMLGEQLQLEKKDNVNIIRSHQNKLMEYYARFGQFKKELYLSMKEELQVLKQQLNNIAKYAQTQAQQMKQQMGAFCQKIAEQLGIMSQQHQLQIEHVKHQYQYGVLLKLQDEKKELQAQAQLKIKEQTLEFYTILAQKQHSIQALEVKRNKQDQVVNQMQSKTAQLQKTVKEAQHQNEQMKGVLSKMNQKVNEAEKECALAKNQVDLLQKCNLQLKTQINNLQLSFKEKIEQCRSNYSSENERLFNKYEKEFSKFIASNKKGLEYSLLQSKSGSLIPTKGCAQDDKLQHIQKQIEEQKRKLNLLSNDKGKMEKTCKIGAEKDYLKGERTKKY